MNKSQRINDMLIFLNKKRQFNLKDIMNRYHISKSTALRDIASLETLGIPIYSDLGRNGSYKILSNDLLSPIIFSIDEISALYFSMLTLENYNMCPFDIDLQKLKEKFENSISEQQLSKITKIEKILQPEVRKTINNSQLRIILDILLHRQEEFFPIKYEQQSLQALKPSPVLRLLPAITAAVLAFSLLAGRYDESWRLTVDPTYFAFRYPRILLAAATGTMLAITGVILQRVTKNPMAGPELLGVSAGTAFGAMASVMLFGITSGSLWFWLAGLASALATLGLLLLFNRKNGLAPEKVLLTGMALAALSDAAIRIWTAGGDFRVQQLLIWKK